MVYDGHDRVIDPALYTPVVTKKESHPTSLSKASCSSMHKGSLDIFPLVATRGDNPSASIISRAVLRQHDANVGAL
jgi:hypothetical protein